MSLGYGIANALPSLGADLLSEKMDKTLNQDKKREAELSKWNSKLSLGDHIEGKTVFSPYQELIVASLNPLMATRAALPNEKPVLVWSVRKIKENLNGYDNDVPSGPFEGMPFTINENGEKIVSFFGKDVVVNF